MRLWVDRLFFVSFSLFFSFRTRYTSIFITYFLYPSPKSFCSPHSPSQLSRFLNTNKTLLLHGCQPLFASRHLPTLLLIHFFQSFVMTTLMRSRSSTEQYRDLTPNPASSQTSSLLHIAPLIFQFSGKPMFLSYGS